MRKIIEQIAAAVAFAAAAIAVSFFVPLHSGNGYRARVKLLAARLLGKKPAAPSRTPGIVEQPAPTPYKLSVVVNNPAPVEPFRQAAAR